MEAPGIRSTSAVGGAAGPRAGAWTPLQAWRLQELYAPIAAGVRAALSTAVPPDDTPPRVLLVGGAAPVLARFLADAGVPADVQPVLASDARLPVGDDGVACAVAIDWLPALAPSLRETAIAELCRVSRAGVVLAHLSDNAAARRAAAVVNGLHRARHGADHPSLGRALEFGLPALEVLRAQFAGRRAVLETRGIGAPATWQFTEAMAMAADIGGAEDGDADVAAALLYPAADVLPAGDGVRTLLVATARPAASPLPAAGKGESAAAIAAHHAIEAAAHRQALERLTDAVTRDRDAERQEFRAALASLAAEIREVEGRADALARDLRGRDHTIGNQQVLLASEAQRASALQQALLEAEARAAAAHAGRDAAERRAVEAEQHSAPLQAHVDALTARVVAAEPLADAYARFVTSRAGRLLRVYTRAKHALRGRG